MQDFMTVLGSHFHDVAAELQQFLVSYVAPMDDCDPGMVRAHNNTLGSRGWGGMRIIQCQASTRMQQL